MSAVVSALIERAYNVQLSARIATDDVHTHEVVGHTYNALALRISRSALPYLAFKHGDGVFEARVEASDEADPYADFSAMIDAARECRNGGTFRVSDVAHNHPFWTSDQNFLFRAHHDAVHVIATAPAFSFAGEVITWFLTARDLGVNPEKPNYMGRALLAEIVGQSAAFAVEGTFPLVDGKQPAYDVRQDAWVGVAFALYANRSLFAVQAAVDWHLAGGITAEQIPAVAQNLIDRIW